MGLLSCIWVPLQDVSMVKPEFDLPGRIQRWTRVEDANPGEPDVSRGQHPLVLYLGQLNLRELRDGNAAELKVVVSAALDLGEDPTIYQ